MSYSELWHIPGPQRLEVFSQTDLASSVVRDGGEERRGRETQVILYIHIHQQSTSECTCTSLQSSHPAPEELFPVQWLGKWLGSVGMLSTYGLSLDQDYRLTSNSTSNSYLRRLCTYQHLPNHLVPSFVDSSRNQSLSLSLFWLTYYRHTEKTMETCPSKWFVDRFHLDEANVLLLESTRPRISVSGPCVSSQQGNWGQHFLCSFVDHVVNLTSDLTYTRRLPLDSAEARLEYSTIV